LATVTKTLEKRHNNVERRGIKYDVEVHVLNLNIVALTVYMVSVTQENPTPELPWARYFSRRGRDSEKFN